MRPVYGTVRMSARPSVGSAASQLSVNATRHAVGEDVPQPSTASSSSSHTAVKWAE